MSVTVTHKTCTACQLTLPVESFIPKPRGGKVACTSSMCRDCTNARKRARAREGGVRSYGFLPAEPLRAILTPYVGRKDVTVRGLQHDSGVPDRTIRRILSGESRRVALDVADRLCIAMDLMLWEVWPDD